MGLIANSGSSQAFKKVPAGVHVARCVGVYDLGTQEVVFKGEAKMQHKIQLTWEVLGEDENGVPMTTDGPDGKEHPLQISKRYTLSLNEKAGMRRDLAAWRGRDFNAEELAAFDVSKLLGAYCMLNVQHDESPNGKTYANVASITPLPSALAKAKPASDTKPVQFDIDAFDQKVFDSLPEFTQKAIRESVEFKARTSKPAPVAAAAGTAFDDMTSDVPF
jgi:hypothetical protein